MEKYQEIKKNIIFKEFADYESINAYQISIMILHGMYAKTNVIDREELLTDYCKHEEQDRIKTVFHYLHNYQIDRKEYDSVMYFVFIKDKNGEFKVTTKYRNPDDLLLIIAMTIDYIIMTIKKN